MTANSESAHKRHEQIYQLLRKKGTVSTKELAEKFSVNTMTIRRDLQKFFDDGTASPFYGGAMLTHRVNLDFKFDKRRQQNIAEKRRIGKAAAKLVKTDDTVFLDTGTTTAEVGKALKQLNVKCRVITSSLVIASELWGQEQIQVTLLGGDVRQGSPDLVGAGAVWMLEKLAADIAFVGSDGIITSKGSYADDIETARIAEKMVNNTPLAVVVADSSKIGKFGKALYARPGEFDVLITDKKADAKSVKELNSINVKVKLV